MTTPYRTSEMPVTEIPSPPFTHRLATAWSNFRLPVWIFRVAALFGGIIGVGLSFDAYTQSVIPYIGIAGSLGVISSIIALGGAGQLIDKGFR